MPQAATLGSMEGSTGERKSGEILQDRHGQEERKISRGLSPPMVEALSCGLELGTGLDGGHDRKGISLFHSDLNP